jgi:hypothetical protein
MHNNSELAGKINLIIISAIGIYTYTDIGILIYFYEVNYSRYNSIVNKKHKKK